MNENEFDPFYYQLFYYVAEGDLQSLQILLQSVEDINSIYYSQITLLSQAILCEKIEIIKYLLSIGIEVNSINYEELMTPFQIACYKGDLSVIQLLYSHGANRFCRMIKYMDEGTIDPKAEPTETVSFGAFVRMDGHRGFGPTNAKVAMDKACDLAKEYGIGIVALGNTNHWLRGGSYGWQAANRGMIGICFSNTTANMPVWGGKDPKIGNNPLIVGIPRSNGKNVVLDMAISQYSYGKIEQTKLLGEQLPYPGGFDTKGNLTCDPVEIEKSQRALPIGYWKGSGLSLVLDMMATVLTAANDVQAISNFDLEIGLSQVFIAIDPTKGSSVEDTDARVSRIIDDIKSSIPANEGTKIYYPAEREVKTREDNLTNGVPVVDEVWEQILKLL